MAKQLIGGWIEEARSWCDACLGEDPAHLLGLKIEDMVRLNLSDREPR